MLSLIYKNSLIGRILKKNVTEEAKLYQVQNRQVKSIQQNVSHSRHYQQ